MAFGKPRTDTELPSSGKSLWRAMKLAYRAEPKLLVVSFVLVTGAMIPEALNALWIKMLADGITAESRRAVIGAAVGFAVSGVAGWLMRIVGDRVHFLFRERAVVAIDAHLIGLQAGVATIEHHERAEHLDRLQLLKDHSFLLNHLYHSAMSTLGSLIRLGITVALLASVHPLLLGLLVFAVPPVITASKRASAERVVQERNAFLWRRYRHFYDLGTLAPSAKEIRTARAGDWLLGKTDEAYSGYYERQNEVRWRSAAWHSLAWTIFGLGYVGAIWFAATRGISTGGVLLVLAAGANLSRYMGMTASTADFLRWTLDAASRLAWLEDYAASRKVGDQPAPTRLHEGIALRNVTFAYPGTDAPVLEDVSLDLPAGAVVAIVGENGAGKTTLVKLLSRFYEPTSGEILVDGTNLADIDPEMWRARLAGAFQDFVRYELLAKETVGVGDLPRLEDTDALRTGLERGGASDVMRKFGNGFEQQLGPSWEDGIELSFGQWQKLALARGFMRDDPLLLVLDEPTAALDAETEHELFERFAAASRAHRESGRITVLVSHRFSTVRMADLIVVLDGKHVVEHGTHDDLMTVGGLYAELYGMQARAYR